MQAYQEITQWTAAANCNHTLLLDGDNMWAYIARGTTVPRYFAKPLRISRRGRKFALLAHSPFDHPHTAVASSVITVSGSNGRAYRVNTAALTCTCPGFTFRSSCKHVKAVT